MKALIVIGIAAIIGIIVLSQSLYIVDETEQVIVLRFGEVQQVQREPGLRVKAPFVDNVVRFDKRVLRVDAPPVSMPDRDRQNLLIDVYARYRIVDPVQFRRTLVTEEEARSRLGDIVVSNLRDRIALRTRAEIIGAQPITDATGSPVLSEEGLQLVEPRETRTEILEEVLAAVSTRVEDQQFGVNMIDVRIKRADFPESVTESIYTRMRSERNRIATRFRAEGEREELRIRADVNRRRDIIVAEADRDSSRIRGEGEAEAIRILAQALNQDPEFFTFRRSLEAYQNFMNQQTTVVLSSEADLFQFLQDPQARELLEEQPVSSRTASPPASDSDSESEESSP